MSNTHLTEEWRSVKGFEGWYEVSNHGQVRRIKPGSGTYPGKQLKPLTKSTGYLMVILRKDGHSHNRMIHLLVLEAFASPRIAGKETNHIDGNKKNNYLDNLEWVTRSENQQHRARVLMKCRGEQHGNAKIDTKTARNIKSRLAAAESMASIARTLDIGYSTVRAIKNGYTWTHV